jgi:pimeloyl-ACP methyl ester carboxylesterase/class 3 adenylate cyclase
VTGDPDRRATRTATVVFTDLVGSTARMTSLDPDAANAFRRDHFAVLERAIGEAGGRTVKNLGDGLMAEFPSLRHGLDGAVAMQHAVAAHDRGREGEPVAIRVGVSTGDVVEERGDLFGEPVVEAARLCAAAEGGQILAPAVVAVLARRSGHAFATVADLDLKGFPQPTPAVAVSWTEPGDGPAPSQRSGPPDLAAQQIKFATSADGVRVAYAVLGDGPPLVKAANWLSHLDYDWTTSVWRHWLTELSSRFRLLRYDERGCGLSDWDVEDLSFDSWVRDLETVVDAAGYDRFPLLGISQGGPVAIAYAVRHPDRVSKLVLMGAFAQGRRRRAQTPDELALADARIEMVRVGWGQPDPLYRQMFISRFLPEGSQEEWREFDELQRKSTSAENAFRFQREFSDIDVVEEARRVSVPTLIASGRREPDNVFEESRRLAALIPDSTLVPLDTASHLLPEHDPAWPAFLAALDSFLADTT